MNLSNKRILIIDDQVEIHDDFRKILLPTEDNLDFEKEKAKIFASETNNPERKINLPTYEIDSAYQGREGYELVKKAYSTHQPYALAFVDIRMSPGWDGIETIKHIWQVDPDIQIVICTAHSDYSWKNIVNELEISDSFLILKKPFDPIEIIQFAAALTKKWELKRSLAHQIETLENTVEKRTAELFESKQFAEQANQIKTQFLRNVSDELINPLNGLVGFAELLSDGKISASEASDEILTSAHHLMQMISDILYISTIDTHEFEFTFMPESIDLGSTINEIKKMYKNLIDKKQLQFAVEINPSVTHIVNDVKQLKRVLYHLISNAIKFTPEKGKIKIKVYPSAHEQVRLEVIDSGIGITEEDFPKLFKPFQQLNSNLAKRYKGLGIGLAVVKSIIDSQGGKVGIEKQTEPGAIFFIQLPIKQSKKE